MKKILSLILSLVIVISAFTPAFGASSEKDLYNQSGEILKNADVLKGSETGDLMLNQKLKRQDMVVLISRLYKEESTAKKHPAKSSFKDVKNAYYKPYVSWAVDKELIVGMTKDTFGFNGPVTVQQFQTLLLRALGYGEEAKDWNNVPKFSEVLGLMEGLSATSKQDVDRGLMAAMTVNALRTNIKGSSVITLAQKLSVNVPDVFNVEAIATVDRNTLKLEGMAKGTHALKVNLKPVSSDISTGEIDKDIPLKEDGRFSIEITNLKSGKYEYKFVSGSLSTAAKTVTIAEIPFDLTDVRADNLKEISLNFTAPVDKISSLFLSNYTTNAGTIKSVRLEDNDTTVILTLNETMKNQKDYRLSINRITSDKGKEINARDRKFTAFDNDIPRVKEVKPLGNKGLRVYLTEPVKTPLAANFKIDGKSFSGQIDSVENVITLKYFSSYYAPQEGTHILTISSLEDYAGHKAVDQSFPFDVVNDKEAPRIIDAKATVEEAIIQFDEEIDDDSINRNNFYWKSGSIKRYPTSVKVLNDKVILNFSRNTLPAYETSIYIDSLSDYSGNRLRNEEVKVTPTVDKNPPEVVGIKVSEDGKSIIVYYSKNVEARNRAFYSIKDKNNRTVNIKSIEGSEREYVVNLSTPLPVGVNTITIQDVYDTTSSKNRMIPYTQQIDMDDIEKPTIVSHSGSDRDIMLLFSKEMDMGTITNYENYLINVRGNWTYLPKDTEFDLIYDGKTLLVKLPEKIDGKTVNVGRLDNIREMQITGLKSINGALINPVTIKFDGSNQGEAKAEKAELIEPDTIKVTFNQPIHSASEDDFSLSGKRAIYDVMVDGSREVILILNNRDETTIDGRLEINRRNSIGTILNTGVKSGYVSITDKVSPRIKDNTDKLYISDNTIELPFTEKLEDKVSALFKKDLIVEAIGEGILHESDYETSLDRYNSTIKITVKNSVKAPYGYSVRLVNEPKYIMDTSGNIVEPSNYDYYTR